MLILGNKLNSKQRKQVLNAFGYRWTVENERRKQWWGKLQTPTMPLQTDAQWLGEHAFHFVADGSRLMANRHHAEPAFMAVGH